MKKMFLIAAVGCTFAACSDEKKAEPAMSAPTDTTSDMAAEALRNEKIAETATMTMPAEEGDMMMKEGKMMIMKAGAWVAMDKDITLANGSKVMLNGDVKMKDHTMKMSEGGMIKTNGDLMDKDGKMLMSGTGMHPDQMSGDTTHKM